MYNEWLVEDVDMLYKDDRMTDSDDSVKYTSIDPHTHMRWMYYMYWDRYRVYNDDSMI